MNMRESGHANARFKEVFLRLLPFLTLLWCHMPMTAFAEFAVTSNFSFLRGGSHPEELMATAMALGYAGLGIADRNSVAGVVRAHVHARQNKDAPRFAPGARLVFADGTPDMLAYPKNRAAWGRLTRLLTLGNLRAEKGECILRMADLLDHAKDMQLAVMEGSAEQHHVLPTLAEAAGKQLWLTATLPYGPHQRRGLAQRRRLAESMRLPLLASNDVLIHAPGRRALQDVLACIRKGVTLEAAWPSLEANAERHLKSPAEMVRIFSEAPEAVAESARFLAGLTFSLDELAYEYPHELREGFSNPQEALAALAWEGAARRYPDGVPETVARGIAYELGLVQQMNYAPYFLTVHDIVRFARARGILCQGRGSAANSTVCFCLGITEVDPALHDLLFERFISPERKEPPDIDVDFEHERREEVIQYIYSRYGRERAGLAAAVTTYRGRSAVRETGKAFGLSEDAVSALSGTLWGWRGGGATAEDLKKIGMDPSGHALSQALELARELEGFPRHLSQHTGGFVITQSRLDEVVPILNAAMAGRTNVEWDKDDLDALKILKIDVLALGMLSCLRKGFDLIAQHYGRHWTLASIPQEERAVYAMISRADTIGVFQIESRAQMSMLPRLKPATFYDLVIEVAIVRPGPIQGDMVHPYLRRRQKLEPVSYPSPELEAVLGKTLGVPLFQEQAMKIAIVAAGFTPGEADQLRRAMATFKKVGTISSFGAKMVEGMKARGYDPGFAARCFKQIEGFGTYGFPESHAASFALLVYASAWIKCRYPDVFAAALLNSQPMGFYAAAQIVRDARDHGVEVREVDINLSFWDNGLELQAEKPNQAVNVHPRHEIMRADMLATHAVRLGLRQVKGVSEADMACLTERRGAGYDSVRDVWLRTRLPVCVLEALAQADAFRSLGLDRREALWAIKGLNRAGDKDDLPLFAIASLTAAEADAHLPPMLPGEHVVEDYRHLRLSLKAHPLAFLRQKLSARGIVTSAAVNGEPPGTRARKSLAGLVLVRQRPGTAKGVIFMTLEDETGAANIIVWPKIFEAHRALVIGARLVAVTGRVQSESGVTHLVAEKLEDLTQMLGQLSGKGAQISSLARADEIRKPQERDARHSEAERVRRVMPGGRNFQ